MKAEEIKRLWRENFRNRPSLSGAQFQELHKLVDVPPKFESKPGSSEWIKEAEAFIESERDNMATITVMSDLEIAKAKLQEEAEKAAVAEKKKTAQSLGQFYFRPSKNGKGYVAFAGEIIVFADEIPQEYPIKGTFRNTGKPVFSVGRGADTLEAESSPARGRWVSNEAIASMEIKRGAKFCSMNNRTQFIVK